MNHDYAHCLDYEKGVCPETCFHAVLTDDLKNWPRSVTYAKIKGTDACPITKPPPKPTHYDRIIRKTPEELAEWIAGIYPDCPPGFSPAPLGCDDVCTECWLEWLRKEAKDGQ